MLSRMMLALSVLVLLVSMVSGAPPVCSSVDQCFTTEMSLMSGSQTNLVVSVSFTIDSTSLAVCGIVTTGANFIQDTTRGPPISYTITAVTGGSVTLNAALEVTSFINVVITAGGFTGTLNGNTQQPTTLGTLQLQSFTGPLYAGSSSGSGKTVTLPYDSPITCYAGGGGDPFFTGFLGQQFFVAGEVGGVMNILSSFNLQLNSRVVFLDNGDALMPAEQERLFLLSEIRHAADPSVPVLDHTTYWSHPGNYFGEAGVAMIDGHRLYAKPGLYKDGWATVTLDDKPLAVSDEYVVVGSGVNAVTIARPSTHRIVFRTLNVEFSLMNSDSFFNVDQVHLEKGWHKHTHFEGVMGRTAKPGFKWSPEMEQEVMVQSGDLFEFVAQPL